MTDTNQLLREMFPIAMRESFNVEFSTPEAKGVKVWSANFRAENFGEAEEKALEILAENDDRKSYILRIERW